MTSEQVSITEELERLRVENETLRARVADAQRSLDELRAEALARRAEVRELVEALPAAMSRRSIVAGLWRDVLHHPDKRGVVLLDARSPRSVGCRASSPVRSGSSTDADGHDGDPDVDPELDRRCPGVRRRAVETGSWPTSPTGSSRPPPPGGAPSWSDDLPRATGRSTWSSPRTSCSCSTTPPTPTCPRRRGQRADLHRAAGHAVVQPHRRACPRRAVGARHQPARRRRPARRAGTSRAPPTRRRAVDARPAPPIDRDIDVLFLGGLDAAPRRDARRARRPPVGPPRRAATVPVRPPGRARRRPGSCSATDKYELLARSRILLNLHRDRDDAPGYFEWARMVEAMANGCAVLTEPSTGYEPLVPGKHFVSRADDLGATRSTAARRSRRLPAIGEAARTAVLDEHPLVASLGPMLERLEATSLPGRRPRADRPTARKLAPRRHDPPRRCAVGAFRRTAPRAGSTCRDG